MLRSQLKLQSSLPIVVYRIMTVSRREDRHLDCHLCGDVFIFSAGEQELLRLRGLERIPTRCPRCQRWSPGQQYLPKVALAH